MFGDREDLSGIARHALYLKTKGRAHAPPAPSDLKSENIKIDNPDIVDQKWCKDHYDESI